MTYSMQAGKCVKCGQPGLLVGPLHGEQGGPLVCIPCGSKIHADIRRRERHDALIARFSKIDRSLGREGGAREDELSLELLNDALRLTHPDRHPPERHELAHRVTQELLALRPFCLPKAKPKPPPPRDASANVAKVDICAPVTPAYPCATCQHTDPAYYCRTCASTFEKFQAPKRERLADRRARRAEYAKRSNERRRRERALRRELWRAVCAQCHGGFIPQRRDSRYCSHLCRQRAYRERVTDKQKPPKCAFGQPSRDAERSAPRR